jgi:hypothetical protein
MTEDFGPLLTALRRVYPTSQLEAVAEPKLDAIRRRYPGVPEHYLAFLRQVGYGSIGGTFMVYSGLCEPDDIFDPATAAELDGLLFFGDDFDCWVVGFDTRHGWGLIGVNNGYLDPEPQEARTVGEFIARRIAEQEDA